MQGAPDGRSVMWLCDIGVWKTALGTGLILLAGDRESPVPVSQGRAGLDLCVAGHQQITGFRSVFQDPTPSLNTELWLFYWVWPFPIPSLRRFPVGESCDPSGRTHALLVWRAGPVGISAAQTPGKPPSSCRSRSARHCQPSLPDIHVLYVRSSYFWISLKQTAFSICHLICMSASALEHLQGEGSWEMLFCFCQA